MGVVEAVTELARLSRLSLLAARRAAVSVMLKDSEPLLVKASILVAWATVAVVVALIAVAPLPTETGAPARFAEVSLRL